VFFQRFYHKNITNIKKETRISFKEVLEVYKILTRTLKLIKINMSTASQNALFNFAVSGKTCWVTCQGDWDISLVEVLENQCRQFPINTGIEHCEFDMRNVGQLDVSMAHFLKKQISVLENLGYEVSIKGLSKVREKQFKALPKLVDPARHQLNKDFSFTEVMIDIGQALVVLWREFLFLLTMIGVFLAGSTQLIIGWFIFVVTLGKVTVFRIQKQVRPAAVITHIEKAGVYAIPIIALMSFLIGGIIAQQGIFQLQKFGAAIFSIDLVSILALRELGVLLTAIMVAGRSGSAITAEIGAMKMREEVDALKVMGADPFVVLALPRILALFIALPLLTVISDVFAMLGGMVVAWIYGGFTPAYFIELLPASIDLTTVFAGLFKAPLMAIIIGVVACVEGFKVQANTESLGRRTTVCVVKSIFLMVFLDGIAAIFYAAIDF